MERTRKLKKRSFIILGALLTISYFAPSLFAGYYWTESAASNYSLPVQNVVKVYEKEFGNKKIVIWDTGIHRIAQSIHHPLGLLYRSPASSQISARTSDERMKFTWNAVQIENERYDVLLAAEVTNEEIQKVLVTNEYPEQENATLKELKEISDLFIEIDVEDGYAVHYLELPHTQAGHFVFRGIDAEGNILSLS